MKKAFIFLFLIEVLLAEKATQTNEDLLAQKIFEKAFGKKSKLKNETSIYLPLVVNNILQDEIFVKINSNKDVYLKNESIEYVLTLLKDEHRHKFKYNKSETLHPLSILNQMGINSKYNEDEVLIEVTIPSQLKTVNLVKLFNDRKVDINGSVLPEDYSGGMNFYVNQSYRKNANTDGLQRELLSASSDLFLNIHDYILEGRFSYSEALEESIVRDRFRLVKNDEENFIRYAIGDIYLPTHQRISTRDTFGISAEKILNIHSSNYANNVSKKNSYEFFLKNKSRVEIFINNRFHQSLTLNSGTHNLYDLKLPTGLNNIQLKIIENGGKTEFLSFSDFAYTEILEKGMMVYGAGVGVSANKDSNTNKWIYDQEDKITSGYLDYGLTNWLTIKSGLEFSTNYRASALELLIGTPLGLLNPYIVESELNNISGYKHGVSYRTDLDKLHFSLNYENIDKEYGTPTAYNLNGIESQLLSANFNAMIPFGITMGFIASKYETEDIPETKYSLDLSKRFNDLFARITYDQIENETSENRIYLTLSYQWDNTQLNYSNYVNDNRQQLDISHEDDARYGLSTNFLYEKNDDTNNYNLRGIFDDEKFILDTGYLLTDNGSQKQESLNFQFATGMVFAGNKSTITAPISSSFLIVDNDDRLDTPLGIKGYQGYDSYVYNSYAIPIGDYSTRTLSVDESPLDFGVDIKAVNEKFISRYRSASTMDIEVNNFLSIKGIVLDQFNEPIREEAFKIFNTHTGKKAMGFTNHEGAFTISGMEIGDYNVRFIHKIGHTDTAKFNFKITKEDMNKKIIDLKHIHVNKAEKQKLAKYQTIK